MSQTFQDHFSGVAARYADFRPHYPAALFDYLATLTPSDALVWDCAAGNGQATEGLAERFKKVIATDASQEQVASAVQLPNVEWRVAPAEQSGLADASVGLITVAQAAHWFDFPKFYAEVNRVLRPGGILALWAYGVIAIESEAVNRLAYDFYANAVGPYWPPERKLVEEGYRTIPFPFAEITPRPFHMETHWTLEQLLGYFGTWSATSRFIKANGKNPIEQLRGEMAEAWGDANATRRVVWPLSMRVGRRA